MEWEDYRKFLEQTRIMQIYDELPEERLRLFSSEDKLPRWKDDYSVQASQEESHRNYDYE